MQFRLATQLDETVHVSGKGSFHVRLYANGYTWRFAPEGKTIKFSDEPQAEGLNLMQLQAELGKLEVTLDLSRVSVTLRREDESCFKLPDGRDVTVEWNYGWWHLGIRSGQYGDYKRTVHPFAQLRAHLAELGVDVQNEHDPRLFSANGKPMRPEEPRQPIVHNLEGLAGETLEQRKKWNEDNQQAYERALEYFPTQLKEYEAAKAKYLETAENDGVPVGTPNVPDPVTLDNLAQRNAATLTTPRRKASKAKASATAAPQEQQSVTALPEVIYIDRDDAAMQMSAEQAGLHKADKDQWSFNW